MADFLTAVKSVRKQDGNENDDALLTAVGSRNFSRESRQPAVVLDDARPKDQIPKQRQSKSDDTRRVDDFSDAISAKQDTKGLDPSRPADTPSEALQILRSQPSFDTLIVTLHQISGGRFAEPFTLDAPGPLQAQIINTSLNEIVPTFWPVLKPNHGDLLISVLRNIAGLNAIVARLRLLASQKPSAESVCDLLEIAERLFSGEDLVSSICNGLWLAVQDRRKREMAWKEFVGLTGSGKVIAAAAQAEDVTRNETKSHKARPSWLASGGEYCAWLGRNIAHLLCHPQSENDNSKVVDASLLLSKALYLGHSGQLLSSCFRSPGTTTDEPIHVMQFKALVHNLPLHSKRTFAEHLLRWLSSTVAPDTASQIDFQAGQDTFAVAGLVGLIFKGDERILPHLQAHLSDPVLSSTLSLPVRRACLTVLARESEGDILQQLLEKLISTFSSPLFVAHAPVTQQEGLAQSILIAAGYVHRTSPMSLLMTARSSGHMQGVSNRLDSSNARARWLGMVVGTALSKLADKPGSQMEFGIEEMESADALWYAELVNVQDRIGTLRDFDALLESREQVQKVKHSALPASKPKKTAMINGKPVFGPPRPPAPAQTKIVGERIAEVLDDASEDEDDLKPYAKPDSDPEDSDEDATLVNRNKVREPVYIRDLMAGLRDDKSFDRFNLSLKTAAPLIRRKAGFGKEVKDHAEELAGMLCNLQDPFDTEDFDDMRLQALVAVLLSDVKVIAPLLSRQAFAEGYSIAQRCVILSALGLSGRELAGFKIEDEDYNPKFTKTDFPSKKLPPRLHAIYDSSRNNQTKRLEAASKSIEQRMIQPMALQAADQSTAHLNAVKVRTFSSRMDVEKARTKRKPPANELAKCFGETFFFPLANRYQRDISAYGSGSVYASAPFVLVTFVKTLALLLYASGPATLNLPQISAEMWDLLLSLRVQAISDISILQAVLFALLTLLEVNSDKQRIAQEHPKQLMETQQWVDLVFERMGSSDLLDDEGKSDEAKVRTLAAGVLMKCRDIIEEYQRLLVGYDIR